MTICAISNASTVHTRAKYIPPRHVETTSSYIGACTYEEDAILRFRLQVDA